MLLDLVGHEAWLRGFLGGAVIGVAATALMLFNGRVSGISGILAGVLAPGSPETAWRAAFLAGMLAIGGLAALGAPASLGSEGSGSLWQVALAGLLVGFGTRLGSGCTSGHGICGISRGSKRSLAAVVTFITTGALTVWASQKLGVNL
jgi:uncharacterized membrane protein YedE/YeeE